MRELLRTNDPVVRSFAESLLAAANIETTVLDEHTSISFNCLSAISCRLMVADARYLAALHILQDAGLAEFLHDG